MRGGWALTLIAVVLAGCAGDGGEGGGGEDDRAGAKARATEERVAKEPARDTTLVAALGDSITAGTPLWDPDPAIRVQLGRDVDRRSQYGPWAERDLPGTRFRNCGVPGERTDEIAPRLDGCARGADVLIVQGGVNDLSQGVAPEDIADNLGEMVRRGKRLGLEVAIVELLPWNSGYPDADPLIRDLNSRIAALARAEDVGLIRWYRVLEDPDRPGRMRARLTRDGAHPTVEGYRLLGEAVELP